MTLLKKGELTKKVPKYAIGGYLANGWAYADALSASGDAVSVTELEARIYELQLENEAYKTGAANLIAENTALKAELEKLKSAKNTKK